MTNNKDYLHVLGTVIKEVGNSTFRVRCDGNEKIITVGIAARFRRKRKRGQSKKIIEGSRVIVALPLDDLTKGDIVDFAEEER